MKSPENRDLNPPKAQSSGSSRLDTALESKPSVQIPVDFAVKVAALAAAQPLQPRRRVPQIGRSMALLLAPLAAIAMFALAPHATPNPRSIIFDTEVILLAELGMMGWWLSRAPSLQKPRWR